MKIDYFTLWVRIIATLILLSALAGTFLMYYAAYRVVCGE